MTSSRVDAQVPQSLVRFGGDRRLPPPSQPAGVLAVAPGGQRLDHALGQFRGLVMPVTIRSVSFRPVLDPPASAARLRQVFRYRFEQREDQRRHLLLAAARSLASAGPEMVRVVATTP